jgi:hypothetical protein
MQTSGQADPAVHDRVWTRETYVIHHLISDAVTVLPLLPGWSSA